MQKQFYIRIDGCVIMVNTCGYTIITGRKVDNDKII